MAEAAIDEHLRARSEPQYMGFERVPTLEQSLSFNILGLHVLIRCSDPELRRLLVANFGAMASPDEHFPPALEYSVQRSDAAPSFSLIRRGRAALLADSYSDFLYFLEKDLTVELQRRRSDLFFLHSAAMAWRDKVCLLAADSGAGKSTTTWALLHHEFDYLSDELSPVDTQSMRVFPYPHALCLKRQPPDAYPLPGCAIHLGRTIHVPARSLPSAVIPEPRLLGAVFLLNYRPDLSVPDVRAIGPAEAGARLYVTALNALAHTNHGLDAVVHIAERVPCFAVSTAGLPATCSLIRTTLEQAFSGDS